MFVLALLIFMAAPGLRGQGGPNVIAFSNPMNIEFMNGPITVDSEPVTGSPYSAEAVTDVVQVLADGNRIVRQNKAQMARDGQGRTRREQGFAMFGPLVNGPGAGDQPRSVQISDPTTGTMIMLDLQNKVAHKMPAPHLMLNKMTGPAWTAAAGVRVQQSEVAVAPPPPGAGAGTGVGVGAGVGAGASVMYHSTSAIAGFAGQRVAEPVVEQLGTTFMEGVAVEGTRSTTTIPAGEIGNEQPIAIVSERWMSPDLKVLVMSKQSDPRFGETTYRLTNLTRGEPSPQLFEMPSDFQVIDAGSRREVVFERKIVK
jgi:hypothetical protein